MTAEQREKAIYILMHYGEANQRRQLIEECAELIQAVAKLDRAYSDIYKGAKDVDEAKAHVLEEMADVTIMIEQVTAAMYDQGKFLIDNMIEYKLNRQLARIEGEGKRWTNSK